MVGDSVYCCLVRTCKSKYKELEGTHLELILRLIDLKYSYSIRSS
jgi:hypothetical protein